MSLSVGQLHVNVNVQIFTLSLALLELNWLLKKHK